MLDCSRGLLLLRRSRCGTRCRLANRELHGGDLLHTEKLKKSQSQSQLREKLENGGFSLSGKFVSMLNAELGSTRLTSIELRLTDVTISEIAMSDLLEISDNLLSQK